MLEQLSFLIYVSFIYLFLAVQGLRCCVGFPLVTAGRGYSLVALCWLLVAVVSLITEHGLRVRTGGLQ